MKPTTVDSQLLFPVPHAVTPKPHFLDGPAARAVRGRLRGITQGLLVMVDGDSTERYGSRDERCPLSATVHVHDPRFYSDIAFGGSIGAGEAYMQGHWSTDDLTALMRILLRNRDVLDGLEAGLARLTAPLQKALHWAARNTRGGSRRNIAAHWEFYFCYCEGGFAERVIGDGQMLLVKPEARPQPVGVC